MDKNSRYFNVPTQVVFWEDEEQRYIGGIAFNDIIICGECGSIIDIDEVYEYAPKDVAPVCAYESWVDIGDAIIGGEYPDKAENFRTKSNN